MDPAGVVLVVVLLLAAWLALACLLALWLGPRLRRADAEDRARQTPPPRATDDPAPPPGASPPPPRRERGTAA